MVGFISTATFERSVAVLSPIFFSSKVVRSKDACYSVKGGLRKLCCAIMSSSLTKQSAFPMLLYTRLRSCRAGNKQSQQNDIHWRHCTGQPTAAGVQMKHAMMLHRVTKRRPPPSSNLATEYLVNGQKHWQNVTVAYVINCHNI